MNIVLFGIKGCGKTTLGKKIAEKLKRAFIDTDALIEDIYQLNRQGKRTCCEIYEEIGPVGFRTLEYEAIQSLQDVQNSVISVGGGTMLLLENVEALSKHGHLVYLIEDKEVLRKRIFSAPRLPAFFDPKDPNGSFERMFEERDDLYRNIDGSVHIDLTKLKEKEAVDQICSLITPKSPS